MKDGGSRRKRITASRAIISRIAMLQTQRVLLQAGEARVLGDLSRIMHPVAK